MSSSLSSKAKSTKNSPPILYKSPLKWAGGKKRIVEHIRKQLPHNNKKRLIEPFVGGGSVFLNLEFDEYLLVDTNKDLINLFNLIKQNPTKLITTAKSFFNSDNNQESQYYVLRERFNNESDLVDRAALFIYLNRHGYNGLCRYNSKGLFNVPFGKYKRPYFPEKEINQFSKLAQRAEFICADFTFAFDQANPTDVIYCDPPYSPVSESANFTHYSGDQFTALDQRRLVDCALAARKKGVSTLISNHYLPTTTELYKSANKVTKLKVQRNISCKGNVRKKIEELMALYEAC